MEPDRQPPPSVPPTLGYAARRPSWATEYGPLGWAVLGVGLAFWVAAGGLMVGIVWIATNGGFN